MDSSELRVFEAVARAGGMGRAAAALNTVQSNVTARVRALEDELGATLFVRHSRGVSLTPAGRRLLPYAGRIATLLVEARRAVADDGAARGPLVLGSLETASALRLPRILAAFAGAYPDVDLTLVTGTTAELIERVLATELDGAFVAGPVRHPGLAEEVMFREELVLVTARRVRGWAALPEERDLKLIVFRAGCSYRQRLEALLAERGVVGVRRLEFGTLDGILGCVAAGIGVTMLPRAVIAPSWHDVVSLHALPAGEGRTDTVFIRRADAFAPSSLDGIPAPGPARADRRGRRRVGAIGHRRQRWLRSEQSVLRRGHASPLSRADSEGAYAMRWHAAMAGLAASLVGIGLARFAYTPLIPALIGAHWFAPATVVYFGAANLARLPGRRDRSRGGWPHRLPAFVVLRAMMLVASASFFASAAPVAASWFFLWRFAAGLAGGVIMVLAAPTVLPSVDPARRGLAGGLIFTGVGLGIGASGTLVPLLLRGGLAATWCGLGVLSLALTALAWGGWPRGRAGAAGRRRRARGLLGLATGALLVEYGLNAFGLVPHMVFLVDFIARGLGAGSRWAPATGWCSAWARSPGRCWRAASPTASASGPRCGWSSRPRRWPSRCRR